MSHRLFYQLLPLNLQGQNKVPPEISKEVSKFAIMLSSERGICGQELQERFLWFPRITLSKITCSAQGSEEVVLFFPLTGSRPKPLIKDQGTPTTMRSTFMLTTETRGSRSADKMKGLQYLLGGITRWHGTDDRRAQGLWASLIQSL